MKKFGGVRLQLTRKGEKPAIKATCTDGKLEFARKDGEEQFSLSLEYDAVLWVWLSSRLLDKAPLRLRAQIGGRWYGRNEWQCEQLGMTDSRTIQAKFVRSLPTLIDVSYWDPKTGLPVRKYETGLAGGLKYAY